jgi:hypothetical protein
MKRSELSALYTPEELGVAKPSKPKAHIYFTVGLIGVAALLLVVLS